MYELRLFGGVSIEGPEGPLTGRIVHRPRLALLALLAAAGPKGMTREKLAGYLWPDSDGEKARHQVSDSVYTIRGALGSEVVKTVGETLRLDLDVVNCDTVAFEGAIRRGALEEAVQVYSGPLLDGFYIDTAPEFERWVEAERQRLGGMYARALESLAEMAEDKADHRKAAVWWERLEAYDQYNSRVVARLMRALAAAGDPANALKRAGEHAALLKQELGIELPDEVRALAEELSVGSRGVVRSAISEAVDEGPRAGAELAESAGPTRRRSRARRIAVLAGAILSAVIALSVAGYIVMRVLGSPSLRTLMSARILEPRDRIVLADFKNLTDDSTIARTVTEAFRIDLYESPVVSTIEPSYLVAVLRQMGRDGDAPVSEQEARAVAIREGLEAVLAGEVHPAGAGYMLSARLIAAETGKVLWAHRATASDSTGIMDAIDSLSASLRERAGESVRRIRRGEPLARATTSSLAALRYYALAVEAATQRDFPQALDMAELAIREDSMFASAYRIASKAEWTLTRRQRGIELAARAYELRDRVTDLERLYIDANYEYQVRGDWHRAAAIWHNLVTLYPNEFVAYNNLGLAAILLGDTEESYRSFRQAAELHPISARAYGSAVRVAVFTRRFEAADTLIRRAESRGLETFAERWRLFVAAALEDWSTVGNRCEALLRNASSTFWLALDHMFCGCLKVARGSASVGLRDLDLSAELFDGMGSREYLVIAVGEAALSEQMRGQPERGRARVESLLARLPADSVTATDRSFLRAYLRVIASELGYPDLAARIASAYPAPDTTIMLERYYHRVGDAAEALAHGGAERALSLLRDAQVIGLAGVTFHYLTPLLIGGAFEQLAEVDSAIAYLEEVADLRYLNHSGVSAIRLPLLERRLGALEEIRGDTAAATRHYQRFLDLWRDADPELTEQVVEVRGALARLGKRS